MPAEVNRRAERALTASAEAQIEEEAPLANAIGIPEEEQRVVSPPMREPIIAVDEQGPDLDLHGPPCCRAEGEVEPPDPHSEKPPPVFIGAKAKSRDERALAAVVELSIPVEIPLMNAIGIPLTAPRDVSEPAYRPLPAEVARSWFSTFEGRTALVGAILFFLLAAFWVGQRRRSPEGSKGGPRPMLPRFSGELLLQNLASASSSRPPSEPAGKRKLEPV